MGPARWPSRPPRGPNSRAICPARFPGVPRARSGLARPMASSQRPRAQPRTPPRSRSSPLVLLPRRAHSGPTWRRKPARSPASPAQPLAARPAADPWAQPASVVFPAYLAAQRSPAAIPAALPSLLPRRDLRPLPFKHPAGPCAPSHPPAPPQNPSSGRRYPELGAEPPAAAGEFFLSRILAAGLISGHADPLARFAVPPIVDPCGPGAGDAQQQPSFELRPRASAQTSSPVPCAANPSTKPPR